MKTVLVILIANENDLFVTSTHVEQQATHYETAVLAVERLNIGVFDRFLIVQNNEVVHDENFE